MGGKGERENKEGVARRRLEKTRASFLEVLAQPGSRIHNTTMDQKALQKFGEPHLNFPGKAREAAHAHA